MEVATVAALAPVVAVVLGVLGCLSTEWLCSGIEWMRVRKGQRKMDKILREWGRF